MLRPQQFCLVLGFLAWGGSVYAQQKDCNKQIVTVTARDKRGEFVSGLQGADFQAKVRGKGADILSAAVGTAQRVVLVLDVSGSMAWRWKGLQRLSSKVINSSENTQFALIIFAGRVLETVEFGHSRQGILSAINQFAAIPPKTKRVVRDSLLNAYDLLQPAQVGDSILVATDERDNDSNVSEKTLENKFNSEGIRFFAIRFTDPFEDTKFLHNELELLSAGTGGAEISIATADQIETVARNIANEIAQYYLLQIALPEPLVKDGSLQLEVINSAWQKRKDVELRFPERLPACTALSAHH
jgi:hypothetical protein